MSGKLKSTDSYMWIHLNGNVDYWGLLVICWGLVAECHLKNPKSFLCLQKVSRLVEQTIFLLFIFPSQDCMLVFEAALYPFTCSVLTKIPYRFPQKSMVRIYIWLTGVFPKQTVKKIVQWESYISNYTESIHTVFQFQCLEATWTYRRQYL